MSESTAVKPKRDFVRVNAPQPPKNDFFKWRFSAVIIILMSLIGGPLGGHYLKHVVDKARMHQLAESSYRPDAMEELRKKDRLDRYISPQPTFVQMSAQLSRR